jgi:hypothetical protein
VTERLDIRELRPDAVFGIPEPERRETVLGNDFLLHEERAGWFVRCLLQVALTGDTTITFGTWVRVDEVTFERARAAWEGSDYGQLRLAGAFANAILPWGEQLLGAPATAEVRGDGDLPYLVASADSPLVSRLVTETWDRDEVLSTLWRALPLSFEHRVTGSWSVRRTAGMHAVLVEGTMRFVGPGRTVIIDAFDLPSGAKPEDVVASMFAGSPAEAEHYSEDGDGVIRRAYRKTSVNDGVERHDLYAFIGAAAGFLLMNCVHDEAADAGWALETFRSVRQH